MASMRRTLVWVGLAIIMLLVVSPAAPVAGIAQQKEAAPFEKVYENTARSFVIVRYELKKSDRPRGDDGGGFDNEQRAVLQRILAKNLLEVVGLLIGANGEVFTSEIELPPADMVSNITVMGPDGSVLPGQADRLLIKAAGRVIRVAGPLPNTWRGLEFAELEDVTSETSLYAATMRADEQNHIHVRPCEYGLAWNAATLPSPCLRMSDVLGVAVVCDAQGRPVGVTARGQIDLGPAGPLWRGKDILSDAGVSADEQRRLEERLEKEFTRNIYEVKITFRPTPQEEEEYDLSGTPYRSYGSGRGLAQERLLYGLGFAEDKVLVPHGLSRETAAGIDTITITVDGKQTPGRFGGVLKQCSATVFELEDGKLPRTASLAQDGRLTRVEPFWMVFARELAGMDVLVEYSRWIDKTQGYADKWYPTVERSVLSGSWLLDRRGRLLGFCGEARYEHDRLEPYLLGRSYERYRGYASSSGRMSRAGGAAGRYGFTDRARLFEAADLAAILNNLGDNYDQSIRHLSKDEQKRRAWLGVEYTRPSKEMVKQMDLRRQTQDGRIGLVVNRVYAASPAARLGLAEGDVLLKIAVPGAPWPIELTSTERGESDMPDFDEADIPKEFEAMGIRVPRRRPWPSRDNELTRMLADIGAGTRVKLSYLHDGEMLEKEFVIEQSPPDMLGAAKYKNTKLGLTVKDMTYEVRAALRLNEEDKAVVITQVEQGTPAALARMNQYELIRAVDGEQVDNVQTFERLITEAQKANKESVRLTVEWMGKTRLADLKFEVKGGLGGLLRSLP